MDINEQQEIALTESVNNEQTAEVLATEGTSDVAVTSTATDINNLSREELVALLIEKSKTSSPSMAYKTIEEIKKRFDTLTEQLISNKKEIYKEANNGSEEGFVAESDNADIDMQTAYSEYKHKLSSEQHTNAQKKREIIAEMETLLQGEYNTYHTAFRELINKYKAIGNVAPSDYQEIATKHKILVDQYFENVRLNNDMRKLDQKKNYEEKLKLCELAEALTEDNSAAKNFTTIQNLHTQWKLIGAVPAEVREEIWARFKAATSRVNERFHKYLDESKDREKVNYEAKLALIAEVEEMLKGEIKTPKQIEAAVKKVTELQEKWRTIGIVPKAVNNEVYAKFRKTCDEVFALRRTFFKEQMTVFKANLEAKNKLIAEAEALKDSQDWKSTFDRFVQIQKKWKTIGPVPHKQSDAIWNRFKSACDYFFEQRNKAFGAEDEAREKNWELKNALLAELKAAKLPEETEDLFKAAQDFQQRWNKIGPLPNKKREIHQEFMDIINKLYDKCASDDASKNMQRFRAKMELLSDSADGDSKLNAERNRLILKIKQLESEVSTLENNIGFFAKSKGSDALRNDIENKINTCKRNIVQTNEKLDIIDSLL